MLDIAVWRNPDPHRLEQLLRERLPALYPGLADTPRTLFRDGTSLCLMLEEHGSPVLIAADPASAAAALMAALRCIETHTLAPDTRVALLCPDAPPGHAWLNREGNMDWLRCEALTVNGEPGLLLAHPDRPSSAPRAAPAGPANDAAHARLWPMSAATAGHPDLTDEEQQFFSHL